MLSSRMEFGSLVSAPEYNSTVITIFTLTFSTFGLLFSIIALVLLFLTALLFREWRIVYKNQLLMQFMIARFIFTSVRYVHDIFYAFEYERYCNPIIVYIFSMIYSEMALVTWQYVFSKHMYDTFVRVCNAESVALWKVSLSAWTIPAIISTLLYILYSIPSRKDLFFLLVYLVFIKWPVLCVNGIQLALILKYILNFNQSKTENNFRIVFVMILLIFTFSIQQAIGDIHKFFYIVIYNKYERVPYLFTLANIASIYQCGFTTLFWLFGNTNTRKLWAFKRDNKNLSACG